ncbi:hypothetical protein BDV18DRAFT_168298 [Aspergillus unguis]
MGSLQDQQYEYLRQELNTPRPMRMVMIGAGVSGIAATKIFQEHFKDQPMDLVLYEKNHDLCGTWLENRYPGCSCDVPAHAYTYSWEGNPFWSRAYVGAEELFEYFKGRAEAYGVPNFVRLRHRVVGAFWDSESGKWRIEVEDLARGVRFTDEAEILIDASGFLNKWKWPDIDGLHSFKGQLVHSAHWSGSFDWTGKTVAVIGSGPSAIQIVPQLQPVVKRLISINRSPCWITPEFGEKFANRDTNFSEEQKQIWAENPQVFLQYRKSVENEMNHLFGLHYKDAKIQKDAVDRFRETMCKRLRGKKELIDILVPDFAVGCRRITPGHGYLKALSADNTTVVGSGVKRITQDGLETMDGQSFKVDAIICATGFDTSFRPTYPLIGEHGKDLRDLWAENPESYLSFAVPKFPNYFIISGPNFTLANGVFIPSVEKIVHHIFAIASKMQTEGLKAVSPTQEAVDDFQEHKDALMKDLVWTSGCRSWYKNGAVDGRVWGPWCGSSLHFMEVIDKPRWEDWSIKYLRRNRFSHLGNGKSRREVYGGDLSYYLSERGLS